MILKTAHLSRLRLALILAIASLCKPAWVKGVDGSTGAPAPALAGVVPLEAPGIHNLFALGTNVYSGSSPEGEEAFKALQKLGVKTIITVDGARPDVETARRHGMRYVHLPHGYDGISTNLQTQLAKAGQVLPGPIYVHCHHGKHRGPTAAAIICMANNDWSPFQGEAWLQTAGTASAYKGLYESVRMFRAPSAEQLRSVAAEFPETATVSGLVDAMVETDERWEHLKAVRAAGYKPPPDHPDIDPANEAVILWERYREAQRLPESAKHGGDFIDRLNAAELEAKEAERLLRLYATDPKPEFIGRLNRAFDAIAESCISCHREYRNPSGIKARQ